MEASHVRVIPMQPQPYVSKALLITIWSCFGALLLLAFPSRTHEAWTVTMVILAGQVLIAGTPSMLGRKIFRR